MADAIEAIECTWVRELDGADQDRPGELSGYEGPHHVLTELPANSGLISS